MDIRKICFYRPYEGLKLLSNIAMFIAGFSFYRPYKGLKRDLRKEASIVSIRDGLYFHEKLKQLLSIT